MTKLFSSVMSLVDVDVGASYHRLKQAIAKGRTIFLVEEHNEALAISCGTQASASAGIQDLLGWIS